MLKTKVAISFLLAPCRSPLVRTNALQLCARKKDIWSGKAQRFLRKKSPPANRDKCCHSSGQSAPQTDCVAGVRGLELGNVVLRHVGPNSFVSQKIFVLPSCRSSDVR